LKKVCIITLGCKLNQFESQALSEKFQKLNYEITNIMEDSEIVVVNTCTVTNKADVKSSQIMKKAKKLGKLVVATGCYATTDINHIEELDYADLVIKNSEKFNIPDLLISLSPDSGKQMISQTEFPIVMKFEQTRAFVKIQDGCDNFCSYCKIPRARGRSRSLDAETVLNYIRELIGNNYKEIVLTGINISDYSEGSDNLTSLMNKILELEGDFRVRLSSLQPDEFDPEWIHFLKNPKFANHFHLSLQSGSRDVLKRMERNYTPEYFLDLIEKIRLKSPDCGISTDIITGFPGETQLEFEETAALVEKARFTRAHIFSYSPRSHTKASKMKDMEGCIKKERAKILEVIGANSAMKFVNERIIGREYRVLIENYESGLLNKYLPVGVTSNGVTPSGYTPNYIKVYSSRSLKENEWALIKPTRFYLNKSVVELVE